MNQIPNIEETYNTREIEEIVEQFEKRMPLITSHGLLLEARLTPTSYLKMKEWLRTTLLLTTDLRNLHLLYLFLLLYL